MHNQKKNKRHFTVHKIKPKIEVCGEFIMPSKLERSDITNVPDN
jgi:hypothetical protein